MSENSQGEERFFVVSTLDDDIHELLQVEQSYLLWLIV